MCRLFNTMQLTDGPVDSGPIRIVVLTLLWNTLAFCSRPDESIRYECSDHMAIGLMFMNIFMRVYRGNSNHYRGCAFRVLLRQVQMR